MPLARRTEADRVSVLSLFATFSQLHRNFTSTSLLVYDPEDRARVLSPRDEGRQCDNASTLPLQFAGVPRPRIVRNNTSYDGPNARGRIAT